MKIETRTILGYLIRGALLFLAGWFALQPDVLPGAGDVARYGIAAGFLVLAILAAEVTRLSVQFEMLLRALRTVTGRSPDAPIRPNGESAVEVLIRALDSREAATREKAHRNLVRLTGQDLPPEREAWEAWWRARPRGGEAPAPPEP